MKKILAIILAAITAFSCLSLVAFAEDDAYTNSYFVDVVPECQEMLGITSLSGSNYVVNGGTFQFTAKAINDYAFDQTTVLFVANTHYELDIINSIINGEESEYGYNIYPDANGVYTIENVTEDLYIYAANLEKASFASIKDFLMNFMYFFVNMIKWFFGLA